MTGPIDKPADTGDGSGEPVDEDAVTDDAVLTEEVRTDQPTNEAVADDAADADFEGPRRRARREREERRAAQERATAIEHARREAKRRVTGGPPDEPKPPARGLIRGLKALMWSALVSVILVGAGLLLYFTPIMSARIVAITGLNTLTQDEILQAAAVPADTPLLQIDTDAVAERVATIRRVASARVQREYPSTLRITIVERVPLVVKDYPDGSHLFDRDGVDFATAPPPPALPYLDADTPGPTDLPTLAALQVLTALRPEVASQVSRIAAPSVAAITLTLIDGRQVIWGTTDRTDEKALKLGALLTQPGSTYDVSSPDLPTVK
ncbi:MAG: cell division septal protein [Mycobacterium sp.]|nr:cell division septal protein [Mycobacterium sp.]